MRTTWPSVCGRLYTEDQISLIVELHLAPPLPTEGVGYIWTEGALWRMVSRWGHGSKSTAVSYTEIIKVVLVPECGKY